MSTLTTKSNACSYCAEHSVDDTIHTVSVAAGEVKEIFVGTYEQGIPQPDLCLETNKGSCEGLIGYLERIKGHGEYSLVYHLDNASGASCQLAMREHFS
jgi:hypothetical protein